MEIDSERSESELDSLSIVDYLEFVVKFGFYSCMSGVPWGGSEALWWSTAKLLQKKGHNLTVNYKWWPYKPKQLAELEKKGADVWYRNEPKSFLQQQRENISNLLGSKNKKGSWLESTRPDAVMVTLGYHPDQVPVADECIKLGIPYAINIQCASNFFFIHSDRLDDFRRWYRNASKVLFVSQENADKLQNNIAMELKNTEIIANPFNVPYSANPEWPETEETFKIACVGRIHFQSKGQDLLVDVMRQDKWKNRNLEITFYGHDQGNKRQLEDLIKMYDLGKQLKFGGFVERVEDIWKDNQALILPSRYEGAPLVVIEAMLCNRMCITTDIGRNRELMDHGESGFVSEGMTVKLIDDVLDQAWAKRESWKQMGELAGQHIRERYAKDPILEFANQIGSLAGMEPIPEPVSEKKN